MTAIEFKNDYHHALPVVVAWSDMDALAHVNNATYFTYMESARIDFLEEYEHLMPIPRKGIGPILAYIDCQFLLPATFPDNIIVGSRITDIGNTSIKMEQAIYSTKAEKIIANSKSVMVLINYNTGEKVRVPDLAREMYGKI